MNRTISILLSATAALTLASGANASFHLMEISQVMTGANGDPSIQFIELRMTAPDQNLVDGISILARDASGTSVTTVFTFPAGASTVIANHVTGSKILIATPAFASRAGILPDFVFAGGLPPVSGQVDYAGGIATVSYGSYTGAGIHVATAASAPGNDLRSLTRVASAGNDSTDFALQTNAPTNNAVQTGQVSSVYGVPLRITEVTPQTGQVEVTNIDVTTHTAAGTLVLSYGASTATPIAGGTTFAAGESKLFTVSGLSASDSDLWLYRDGNLTSPLSIVSGLKFGPTPGVGRVAVAVAAGIWPSTSAFVPTPGVVGQSLRLTAYDGTNPANWAAGTPSPGAFFGTGTLIATPFPVLIPKGDAHVALQPVVTGMTAPLGIAVPDDGSGRILVYDQAGSVTLLLSGTPLPTPFLDVSNRLVPLGLFPPLNYDERGLLGLATHPAFAANPKVYTYTSEPAGSGTADFTTDQPAGGFDHQDVVAEWTVDPGNPNVVNPASRRELLRTNHPQFNHNGGTMRFGPDGMLYISIGDGGGGDDEGPGHDGAMGNAQDTSKIFGKILRINPDGNNSANGKYGIPADNPFVGGGGLGEVYAYGLRNPYTFHFDPGTGLLYVGDAGQNKVEEVDVVAKGSNNAWHHMEGGFFFDTVTTSPGDGQVTTIPTAPVPLGATKPLAQYGHGDGVVVIGGTVPRSTALPALAGRYVFGDFGTSFASPSGRLFYLDGNQQIREAVIDPGNKPLGLFVKGFGQDAAGDVYVCGSTTVGPFGTTGVVVKLVSPTSGIADWKLFE